MTLHTTAYSAQQVNNPTIVQTSFPTGDLSFNMQ